ncbi:hypothetical protein S2091_2472 [Solimicrobium silvestre]|uniref:Uncharacterized protein n=1 Tax=Solimicrobium silvestre TaxID=2099400 RepID=A0A2S9GYE0_9BURK|nr:hypothetical protein S2091_2472 [Solimicrobium silvestre]
MDTTMGSFEAYFIDAVRALEYEPYNNRSA